MKINTRTFFQVALFILIHLISNSCKKEEDNVNENIYGTVELLKEGCHSPLWSPDGKQIAYLMDDKLYVMNSNGTGSGLITSSIYETPKWSPTGMELAYLDHRPPNRFAIYKINIDGTNEIKLTGSDQSPDSFSWSPDGKKIVYGDYADIYHEQ